VFFSSLFLFGGDVLFFSYFFSLLNRPASRGGEKTGKREGRGVTLFNAPFPPRSSAPREKGKKKERRKGKEVAAGAPTSSFRAGTSLEVVYLFSSFSAGSVAHEEKKGGEEGKGRGGKMVT